MEFERPRGTRDFLFEEMRERKHAEDILRNVFENYGFGEEIAKACVDKGWEDGHAGGYGEVRAQAEIAADFAEKILSIKATV